MYGAKPNEQKAIEWYRENLEINLDSNEAACFTKIFSFRKESCLADVEEKIRVKIGEILGTDNSDAIDFCLNSLLSKLNIWATSRREKQEITRENVYGALCYTEPVVPSYELCPEKPILPSRQRFGETFIDDIKKNSNHIIFLEGLPGCGKTNFISYLSQMNESIVDFRFYTYLPVNKVDGSYSDDEGFYLGNILWRSILVQLKKKFEENNLLSVVKFPLIYQFMSVSEMRETVIHFLPEYAKCIGRPCYFFIDGLDHAARSKDARNSFLSQLPRPEEIGDDFYFVLVGQPINDGYPSWMKDNKGITYYSMPALDTDDIVILLEQSGVAENTVDMENLAKTVISVIGNNVLNIIFAILELKKMVLPLSFEAIEKELNSRFLNKQIDKYYEWIISSQEKSLLLYKIEAIMAFSSKRINAYDVAQMCGVEHDEAAFVLNGLYPIIVCEGDRYFAFHNDVRLFLQNAIIHNSNIKGITESIINRIKQDRELWKYRYDISFNLLVSCKATDEVLKLIDVEYVMDSALYGISFDRILQQFILAHQLPMDNLEEVCMQKPAIGTQNVGLDVGLAELIKAIALEMNSDKEEIQYESIKDEESDVGAVRDVYYKMVQSWYVSSEFEEYTTNTYSKGASAWKNWAEKIESGEMEGKDAIVAFYEKQLAEAKLEVMALEQRLEAIKNDEPAIFPVTAEEIEDINDAYVEYFGDKYGKQTDNHRYADVYIGQMLWAFLTQENF